MKVAILGYGTDGASATGYWHKQDAEITICDEKTDLLLPEYVESRLGPEYLENLGDFDVIVRSPGIRPDKIVAANGNDESILKKVTTTVNEFFAHCPAPIIAVTGTKGKGTTSMLIYKMLTNAGKKAFIGGNIGTVPLDFIHDVTEDSIVVLELSSFQLIDFKYAPKVGVCLMVVPEHQDWHTGIKEYYDAKSQLFANQAETDRAVFNAASDVSRKIVNVSKGSKVPYFVPPKGQLANTVAGAYVEGDQICMDGTIICDIANVGLLGRHNLENVCAAIAAVWPLLHDNIAAIKMAIHDFTGMEHRLEFVREVNYVKYYNDSFATTPEATVAAIRAFDQPKVVILGGHDKGIPFYDVVNEVINSHVRRVIVIGKTGEKIMELLVSRGYEKISLGGNTMTEIVHTAQNEAQPGDVVLLSTACASFGLFKDYKDRGNQFKEVVNAL
ncbi:MAG: UDP-N-acetylmuramoyl-L-alanine--D-glutamate ligase [Candidatus Saccharimonadales bacterium]